MAKFLTKLLVILEQRFWSKAREPKANGIVQAFVQSIRIFATVMIFVNVNRYMGNFGGR